VKKSVFRVIIIVIIIIGMRMHSFVRIIIGHLSIRIIIMQSL
jgi:hypothetical protein